MMRRSENRLQMRTKQLCSVIRQGMAAKRYRGQAAVNSPAEQRWDRGHACRFSYYNEGTLDTVTDRAGRITKFTCTRMAKRNWASGRYEGYLFL